MDKINYFTRLREECEFEHCPCTSVGDFKKLFSTNHFQPNPGYALLQGAMWVSLDSEGVEAVTLWFILECPITMHHECKDKNCTWSLHCLYASTKGLKAPSTKDPKRAQVSGYR